MRELSMVFAAFLDYTDHEIDAFGLQAMTFLQHQIGLADTRRESEVDLQSPAL